MSQVTIEQTNIICDHCFEQKSGIIIIASMNHDTSAVELCMEHAEYFAKEILKIVEEAK